MSERHLTWSTYPQQQRQQSQKPSSNIGHQGHFIVPSSQRPHSTSDGDMTEYEDFTNDASTKIVQRRHKRKQVQIHTHNHNTRQNANRQSNPRTTVVQFDSTQLNQSIQSTQFIQSNQQQTGTMTALTFNNDQLTEEAERFARTRYPFPPFIVLFPLSNIKEQKVSDELCKHLKENKHVQLELIGYRRSTLKCAANECDILLFVKDSLSFSFLYKETNWPTTLLGSTFIRLKPPSILPQLSLIIKGVGLSINIEHLTIKLKSMFSSLENVVRMKKRFQQEIILVKLEFNSPGERENLLSYGKLSACSTSFAVEAYLAQARVLICGKCCSIGHFRRQCRQNGETCRKCGQTVSDIKQHFPLCSKQLYCIHCKQNHASDDMKYSEVEKFRADRTCRLLNSNNNLAPVFSSPAYSHDQSNFPQLPPAQKTTVTNSSPAQSAEIINKLYKINTIILKLNDKIEKLSPEFEGMRKSNEELKRNVLILSMENQTFKPRINESEELSKDILLPFCRDPIKFVREKNTNNGRHLNETLHSHLEIYGARLNNIVEGKQFLK
ncbi:unnamed protein product [Rotaria sp. Silwood2]|nr:unnamed protein product [Rotaria sp. Silwood2]CAF2716632.1 unnamed protein product [Rotaria sp. Silwood2]CAF4326588.1 unnamed protein product [Rotaria sp. Silwood2]